MIFRLPMLCGFSRNDQCGIERRDAHRRDVSARACGAYCMIHAQAARALGCGYEKRCHVDEVFGSCRRVDCHRRLHTGCGEGVLCSCCVWSAQGIRCSVHARAIAAIRRTHVCSAVVLRLRRRQCVVRTNEEATHYAHRPR